MISSSANDTIIMSTNPKQQDSFGSGNDNELTAFEQNNTPQSIPQNVENSQHKKQRRQHSL